MKIDLKTETLVTLTDVAKRLGVHRVTVQHWALGRNKRKLEALKIGGKSYTTLEALGRFSTPIGDNESESDAREPGVAEESVSELCWRE